MAEQILLSASNMVASLVVVKTAGLEWFGIYSFIFVLTTLVSAFFSTLLHRQMILFIASSTTKERRQVFIVTLLIQAIAIALMVSVLVALLNLYSSSQFVSDYRSEVIAAAVFISTYNFYDLCRQYLYVLDGQRYSLQCTIVYCVTLAIGLVVLVLNVEAMNMVAGVYGLFSLALVVSLLSNRRCRVECQEGEWVSFSYLLGVLKTYYEQGRYRLVGMSVTWAQNQSMTPILMWLGGPLIAGYFSMARLLVMPMAVVNHGLTNSTAPELRRIYEASGTHELRKGIRQYVTLNFAIAVVYLSLLFTMHATGLLYRFVPEYEAVKWYLMIWIVTLLVTMYRHWLTQLFVVSMKFKFLMNVSILALIVTMSGMVGAGYFLENVYIALTFVVVGELLSIVLFRQYLSNKPQS